MSLRRLRAGEWTALGGAIALAVLLPLDWFLLGAPDARIGAHETGIRGLGWFAALLVLAAIAAAVALASTTAATRAPAWPVILSVITTSFGLLATLAIAIRLLAQPGLGVGAGNADVDLEPAAWLGLGAAAILTVGGWRAMSDERLDARESLEQTEEVLRVHGAPRPAPPPSTPGDAGPPDAVADPAG